MNAAQQLTLSPRRKAHGPSFDSLYGTARDDAVPGHREVCDSGDTSDADPFWTTL